MEKSKKKLFQKFLDGIEKVGNKLPNPVTLFLIMSLIVIIVSQLLEMANMSVTYEISSMVDGKLQVNEIEAKVVSLMNFEGIRHIFSSFIKNFVAYPPLGVVLIAMLGVGMAEGTGFIDVVLKRTVSLTPPKLVTYVLVFLGVMSNIASDVGYVVLIPLGAVIFLNLGRHPLAGLVAVFAGVSGGFSANLLVGPVDTMLSAISTASANILQVGYEVSSMSNWYFLMASTILITIVGGLVTEKIIEPRLGQYTHKEEIVVEEITDEELKAIRISGISLLIYIVVILLMTVPSNGILRNQETGALLLGSAFNSGLVPIISLAFFIPGLTYGILTKKIKSDNDAVKILNKTMSTMGSFLVLAFVSAQFINYFSHTKLGIVLAVKGADFLENAGLNGLGLIVVFVFVSAFINLFIGSASAKWSIMAPVFVPLFMRLGYSPELVQLAYRIGDSSTNIITPLMTYFALIIAFAKNYVEDVKIGTLISLMLPYSITFLISWTLLLIVWLLLGLPIGPNIPLYV